MNFTEQEFNLVLEYQMEYRDVLDDTSDEALLDLIKSCQDDDERNLIDGLLRDFKKNMLDAKHSNDLMFKIAAEIAKLNYPSHQTAIVAMATGTDADGSQEVLNQMKVPLKLAHVDCKYTDSRFTRIQKLYNKGIRHFIIVDDFIGSGKTVLSRVRDFKKWNLQGSTINFFFLAGMNKAISLCRNNDIPVFCPYTMRKALSGCFVGSELLWRVRAMCRLESRLAPQIKDTLLKENQFGYNHAEALYRRCYGNIPNSVFPVFWWEGYRDGSVRKPVFVRVQKGY